MKYKFKLITIIALILTITACNVNKNRQVGVNQLIIFSDPLLSSPSDVTKQAMGSVKALGFNAVAINYSLIRDEVALSRLIEMAHQLELFFIIVVSVDELKIPSLLNYPIDGLVLKDLSRSSNLQGRLITIKDSFEKASKKRQKQGEQWGRLAFFSAIPAVKEEALLAPLLYSQKKVTYIDAMLEQLLDSPASYQNGSNQVTDYFNLLGKHATANQLAKPLFIKEPLANDPVKLQQATYLWATLPGPLFFVNQSREGFFSSSFYDYQPVLQNALLMRSGQGSPSAKLLTKTAYSYVIAFSSAQGQYLIANNVSAYDDDVIIKKRAIKKLTALNSNTVFVQKDGAIILPLVANSTTIYRVND